VQTPDVAGATTGQSIEYWHWLDTWQGSPGIAGA
jgi:hypothetical protein